MLSSGKGPAELKGAAPEFDVCGGGTGFGVGLKAGGA